MNRKLQTALCTTGASVLACSVLAQDPSNLKTDASEYTRPRAGVTQSERLGSPIKASTLIGMTVNNYQNEKLGTVENMMVDLPSGRVVVVIITSGGFLGIGDELSAVPPTTLLYSKDHASLLLDTSKDLLSKMPHFRSNQWPDFGQPLNSEEVYRAYHVVPYFATNFFNASDKMPRESLEPHDVATTPLDQGNSASDINTTAQIRKGIVDDPTMSVNAQNVKIMTNKGQVTLRGSVNTAMEKRTIGDIASRIVLEKNVDNQLVVK